MGAFLPWLVATLRNHGAVSHFMHSKWGWPFAESTHFIGLSLLIGAIGTFDLRMLGIAPKIPLPALHRVIPWGIAGYCINICTGLLFLTTEPDQYIYNPSFHFKIMFMGIAGLNVLAFYTTQFKKIRTLGPGDQAPIPARVIAGVSLFCWVAVIVCGRLLTFFRPGWCGGYPAELLYYCIPSAPLH
jgi:hypothetical protein